MMNFLFEKRLLYLLIYFLSVGGFFPIDLQAQTSATYTFTSAVENNDACGTERWDNISTADSRVRDLNGTSTCLDLIKLSISSGSNPGCNAAVTGIRFNYSRRLDAGTLTDNRFQLIVAGTPSGDNKAQAGNWSDGQSITLGSTTDTWGLSLTEDDINNSNFGIRIVLDGSGTAEGRVENISIVVEYAACPGDCSGTGYADVVVSEKPIVVNTGNMLGAADDLGGQLGDMNSNVVLDLTDTLPTGYSYNLLIRQACAGADSRITLEESTDNISYTTHPSSPLITTNASYDTKMLTTQVDTRYLRLTLAGTLCAQIDAVTYTCLPSCSSGTGAGTVTLKKL